MPKAPKEKDQTYPFIKKLAANDRPTRDAALESLTKFLRTKRKFDLIELQKLWKGLYFSMWFSDRPRTQQRLADDLAGLISIVHENNFPTFLLAFWTIIAREWDGIDKHRIDKFYLLIRRYVAGSIRRIKEEKWEDKWVKYVVEVFEAVALNVNDVKIPNALRLHMFDIYLDEIERILKEDSKGEEDDQDDIDYDSLPLKQLIAPVETIASESDLKMIRNSAKHNVLEDARLIKWGVVEVDDEDGDEGDEEEEDDDEWGGFD